MNKIEKVLLNIKKPVAWKDHRGYLLITINHSDECKHYRSNRFIYECFLGLIVNKKVVDHFDNRKTDNRLGNLKHIIQRENCKKDARKGQSLPPIRVKAINTETNETFYCDSIYKAEKNLNIHSASIFYVLKGMKKTAYSKKYKKRFAFEKIL